MANKLEFFFEEQCNLNPSHFFFLSEKFGLCWKLFVRKRISALFGFWQFEFGCNLTEIEVQIFPFSYGAVSFFFLKKPLNFGQILESFS